MASVRCLSIMSTPIKIKIIKRDDKIIEAPPRDTTSTAPTKIKIINKGTGAGGSNTTLNGKAFEQFCDVESNLLKVGFSRLELYSGKHGYYMYKKLDNDTKIYHVKQNGFAKLVDKLFGKIETERCPDEVFIVCKPNQKPVIKVLEKKVQSTAGSVDVKLWASYLLREEYEEVFGNEFVIEYGFCLGNYFKEKFETVRKFKLLKKSLDKYNIPVMYGTDDDYFEKLSKWVRT